MKDLHYILYTTQYDYYVTMFFLIQLVLLDF